MRISASAAVLALSGSLVLAGATSAAAAPGSGPAACSTDTALSLAVSYSEFVEGDAVRSPDSEGAVAVGGDADFTGGFSVGSHIGATAAALRDGASLVVGGTLKTGDTAYTVLEHGSGVYGKLDGRPVEVKDKGARAVQGAAPIDFPREFRALRATSARLARQSATGTADMSGAGDATRLTLSGDSAGLNVFSVGAAQLQQAKRVVVDTPAGSTTLVNVTGGAYDQAAAATYRVDGPAARLLWNFPDATEVTKNSHNAWPGTVLAPHAAVDLGDGGPVDGTVIAASLRGTGSAETHHYPFSGCLTPAKPSGGAASVTPPATPAATPATPAATPTAPAASTSAPANGAGGDDHRDQRKSSGSLALTGGTVLPLAGAGAAVLVAGCALAYAARRRRRQA
ncbi:choice-of-anchor A family protein [Streptomyces beihaiensis]|uniref:Choice-of-anchor A family protein n=1 Tax=Streptomyces beihaiensis TaxID=2984495 RepID=A0ABT3TRN4_9ACTN|nr:choice-of-anchor A family protein [Streptomyces beihaiensis]MCX3059707.1 choice-of-anchor A family protein [Streptomyces beihaiensis]